MRYRCVFCGEWPAGFVFEGNGGQCPKCGASGPKLIAQLVDVHFLFPAEKGPIAGQRGRLQLACMPQRSYLATPDGDFFSASGDARAVTCPKCKGHSAWREAARQFDELAPMLESAAKLTVDLSSPLAERKAGTKE
jgi:hypothetical protein